MPKQKRHKTNYPEVFYIHGKARGSGKSEKIFYIRYVKDNKRIEEKAGRQFQDDMTAAKAASIRAQRIEGNQLSNEARRMKLEAEKNAEADRWTIDKLWNNYKEFKPELKGIVTDENRYKNHIKPIFGDKEPKDIAPLDVDRLRHRLLKTKQPGTVKNILELFRRIINYGMKKNLCDGLGFTVEMPKVHNQKTEDLTPEQLENLWEAISEEPNIQVANLMRLVLFTGMRRGELFRLKWGDIDYGRGFIHLRDPKGGPDQDIPMNNAARAVLEDHERSDSAYVFPGRGGRQRVDIKKQVNKVKERAGLPKDFRALHGLRHVYASMLASSGQVDLYTLQKLLTHKSPVMTQRYAHLHDEALRRASTVAEEIIGETVNTNINTKIKKLSEPRK